MKTFKYSEITPEEIYKTIDGQKCEPFEDLILDIEEQHQGVVIEKLGERKAQLINLTPFENNKFLSDNAEGTLYYQSETKKVHNTTELPNSENILQKSLSQKSMFDSMKIAMTVPGFTGLSCGDLIAYEMPSYEPSDKKDPLEIDP